MAEIEAARLAIWNALLSSKHKVLIIHAEPPIEYEVPGAWMPEGDRTWVTGALQSERTGHAILAVDWRLGGLHRSEGDRLMAGHLPDHRGRGL